MVSMRSFFFLCALSASSGLKQTTNLNIPNYTNALTDALVEIIETYETFYVSPSNLIHLYYSSDDGVDIVSGVLSKIGIGLGIQLEGFSDFKVTNRKRVNNVFFVDSYKSFYNIIKKMSPNLFDYQGKYLIVLTKYSSDQYKIMLKMFEFLWAEYIINVNLIFLAPENENEAVMYTYYPYTAFFCGKAVPIQLNQFRFGKWLHKIDFFPAKVSNLYGCPISIASVNTPPFMIFGENKDGTLKPDGIDGVVLRVLAEKMNFTINLKKMDTQGEIYSNGSASGSYQMIISKKANLTIGFVSTTPIRDSYMTSSYIYYTCNLIWIVPPGRLLSSLEKLIQPFKAVLWLCVLSVFIISSFAIILVNSQSQYVQNFVYGRKNSGPCLNFLNVFFGGSLAKLPKKNFARFLLAIFMFYCLIIRGSYTGALFKFMRSESREKPIASLGDMVQKNYEFYVLQSSQEYISAVLNVVKRATVISRDQLSHIQDKLQEEDFNGALLSTEEHVAYLNAFLFPNKFYHHADEIFFTLNLCIYLHRQSCLTHQINEIILKLTSTGFVEAWAKQFVDMTYLKERKTDGPKVLVNNQLSGAYQLFVMGIFSAFIIFLCEIVSTYCRSCMIVKKARLSSESVRNMIYSRILRRKLAN